MPFKSEVELAKVIITYLQNKGYEVYQEVQLRYAGDRADIVATKDNDIWVIQTKLSFNPDVCEQAYKWMPYANLISVAVPWKRTKGSLVMESFLRIHKLGLLKAQPACDWRIKGTVDEWIKASDTGADTKQLKNCLSPEHKDFAEAGSSGKFWTPFKNTTKKLVEYVSANPNCTVKVAIKNIDHHYATDSSAIACIRKAIVGYPKLITELCLTDTRPATLSLK